MKLIVRLLLGSFVIFTLLVASLPISAQQPVVHAILFYSPTCTHCHEVVTEHLPPLVAKYPGQLDIAGIDVSHAVGQNIYQAALVKFNVPDERIGVPTLIVGDTVLVGSLEIPEQFPVIVEQGLQSGGINWPDIPGLQTVLASQDASSLAAPPQQDSGSSFIDKFNQDPLANSFAVVVLVGMLVCLVITSASFIKGAETGFIRFPGWLLPLLALVGLGVAAYLSSVEIFGVEAVCGPVGNCNSVQESEYAYLFGFLPVGVLGLIGYLGILVAWAVQNFGPATLKKTAALLVWAQAWFGVLFSIYLTFLEPFVIGATCAWCISSAILITLILMAATAPAKLAMTAEDNDDVSDQDEE